MYGQGISSSAYPELYAAVGGSVPDLRGLFLRGVGGNAAGLGSTQSSSLGDHTHEMWSGVNYRGGSDALDRFSTGQQAGAWMQAKIQTLGVTGSTGETRPVNKSVRYLIRAKP